METEDLPKEVLQFKNVMRLLMFVFGVAGITYLFCGDQFILFGNWLGADVFKLPLPPMPMPIERFWLTHTFSLMMILTALCYQIQKDVLSNMKLTSFVLIGLLSSTILFISYFFSEKQFNYILGAAFCDGPLFLIVFLFYRRALMSLIPPCLKNQEKTS